MISFRQVILKLIFLFLSVCLYVNCATSNCYTARTLEQGKVVLTPAVDNLAILAYEDKQLSWSVISLGIGLPRNGDIVIPEINFQIPGNNFDSGIIFFGLGVRALIR